MDTNRFAQTQGFYRLALAGALALTVNVAFAYALGHGKTPGQLAYNVGTDASTLTAGTGARISCAKAEGKASAS
jgi:hypothetical protein